MAQWGALPLLLRPRVPFPALKGELVSLCNLRRAGSARPGATRGKEGAPSRLATAPCPWARSTGGARSWASLVPLHYMETTELEDRVGT